MPRFLCRLALPGWAVTACSSSCTPRRTSPLCKAAVATKLRASGWEASMSRTCRYNSCAAACSPRRACPSARSASSRTRSSGPDRPACVLPLAMLHGVGGTVGLQSAAEVALDLLGGVAGILVAELHADAGRALALGAARRHPDDLGGHRQALGGFHELQQDEDFVAQLIGLAGGDEQAAVLDERHVRAVQGALVLDRQVEDALLTRCAHART